jgi:hypothetical protein
MVPAKYDQFVMVQYLMLQGVSFGGFHSGHVSLRMISSVGRERCSCCSRLDVLDEVAAVASVNTRGHASSQRVQSSQLASSIYVVIRMYASQIVRSERDHQMSQRTFVGMLYFRCRMYY